MAKEEGGDGPRKPSPTAVEYYLGGLAEGPTPFVFDRPDVPTLATFLEVRRTVLDAYGRRCAMTGGTPERPAGLAAEVDVVAIRPEPEGGRLHASNFITLSVAAANAFRLGHIAVWGDFRLIADLSTIDPELLERLNPDGRLILPKSNPPDADALRWHRENVFATRIQSG